MDNKKNIQPVNLQLIQANHEEDEISLYDIWQILVEYKFFIASIIFIFTLAALIYAIQATPVYQAEAHILPPNERDIEELNITEIKLSSEDQVKYTPKWVYEFYIKNSKSLAFRRKYFEENNLLSRLSENGSEDLDPNEVFEKEFNEKISIDYNNDEGEFTLVSFLSTDAIFASEVVNNYITFIDQKTVRSLKKDAMKSVASRIEERKKTIDDRREV